MSFQFLYNGNRIYDAKTLVSDLNADGSVTLEVLNAYEEDRVITFYVQPASTGGDVDFPVKISQSNELSAFDELCADYRFQKV